MHAVFNLQETFRDDFSYRNSPRAIRRFPLPFPEDSYMYSVNIEPHLPGPPGSVTEFAFDVDEDDVAECREREIFLAPEPLRYQALPHMMSSQWDCLELIMESLARDYPAHFSLSKQGNRWHWINRPLEIDQRFTFGDTATLPREPLDYITRQAQGDFVVMDQREGDLWAEAGMVTTQTAGDLVHLRVELQGLWRLPRSNAIVFGIRCYLISLRELATVPKWARRVHRVLRDLHPALVDYKGLTRYRDAAVAWLAPFDDGSPTTPGTAPE